MADERIDFSRTVESESVKPSTTSATGDEAAGREGTRTRYDAAHGGKRRPDPNGQAVRSEGVHGEEGHD